MLKMVTSLLCKTNYEFSLLSLILSPEERIYWKVYSASNNYCNLCMYIDLDYFDELDPDPD